ncbi:MAG: ImmA/IrrE family metallo-endopeptidase [Oscillospiraceae bacterium]|nr:ImmA/IrrE family metallo-endopeptidase [Oscillospiraceae bacterium]
MNYKYYQNARDAVWRLLIDLKVGALPVRPGAMCRTLGIKVRYCTPEDGNDGMSFLNDGVPTILVSSAAPLSRQRFTAAHELGHILLGHVGRYQLVNREPSPQDNPIEQAANVFASRLLAPACVLWGCNARTPEQIAGLCDISLQAARFRAERMAVLYQRGKFLISPLERQVYRQFSDYIATHKL